jgi:hypothetical protein
VEKLPGEVSLKPCHGGLYGWPRFNTTGIGLDDGRIQDLLEEWPNFEAHQWYFQENECLQRNPVSIALAIVERLNPRKSRARFRRSCTGEAENSQRTTTTGMTDTYEIASL